YDIERFNRAKETIRSPITIENETETDRKTRETVSAIGDRYTVSKEITTEQIDYLEELFDGIKSINEEASKDEDAGTPIEEKVTILEDRLSEEIADKIDSVVFMQLLRLDEKDEKKVRKYSSIPYKKH